MVPLNSRIALNRLDSTDLVSITSDYEKHVDTFRKTYQAYDEALSGLLNINCVNQPAHFYNTLSSVRDKRQEVAIAVEVLNRDIAAYRSSFVEFATPYRGGTR